MIKHRCCHAKSRKIPAFVQAIVDFLTSIGAKAKVVIHRRITVAYEIFGLVGMIVLPSQAKHPDKLVTREREKFRSLMARRGMVPA